MVYAIYQYLKGVNSTHDGICDKLCQEAKEKLLIRCKQSTKSNQHKTKIYDTIDFFNVDGNRTDNKLE